MQKIHTALLAALLATSSHSAPLTDAQQAVFEKLRGTIFIVPHRESADGKLEACGLEFSALSRDFSTKNGAPIKLVGSYYLRGRGEKMGVALKLGVFDDFNAPPTARPNKAFARSERGDAPSQVIPTRAENEGFGLYISGLDDSFMTTYQSILEKREFVIVFNRKPGQQDVPTRVDLTVEKTEIQGDEVVRTRSNAMVDSFVACTADLMK